MNIVTQFFKNNPQRRSKEQILHDLMKREAELNENLFGPLQQGGKREFFNLDTHTWIWYEEWVDDAGDRHKVTTRYVVRPKEIVKSQNGGAYHRLSLTELDNFQAAIKTYVKNADEKLYNKLPSAQR